MVLARYGKVNRCRGLGAVVSTKKGLGGMILRYREGIVIGEQLKMCCLVSIFEVGDG